MGCGSSSGASYVVTTDAPANKTTAGATGNAEQRNGGKKPTVDTRGGGGGGAVVAQPSASALSGLGTAASSGKTDKDTRLFCAKHHPHGPGDSACDDCARQTLLNAAKHLDAGTPTSADGKAAASTKAGASGGVSGAMSSAASNDGSDPEVEAMAQRALEQHQTGGGAGGDAHGKDKDSGKPGTQQQQQQQQQQSEMTRKMDDAVPQSAGLMGMGMGMGMGGGGAGGGMFGAPRVSASVRPGGLGAGRLGAIIESDQEDKSLEEDEKRAGADAMSKRLNTLLEQRAGANELARKNILQSQDAVRMRKLERQDTLQRLNQLLAAKHGGGRGKLNTKIGDIGEGDDDDTAAGNKKSDDTDKQSSNASGDGDGDDHVPARVRDSHNLVMMKEHGRTRLGPTLEEDERERPADAAFAAPEKPPPSAEKTKSLLVDVGEVVPAAAAGANANANANANAAAGSGHGHGGHSGSDVQATPAYVPLGTVPLTSVVSVGCGWGHTVLLDERGVLYTFGDGAYGRLGHGNSVSVASPKLVEELRLAGPVRTFAVGDHHTIAVMAAADGHAYSWGQGAWGRLGLGTQNDVATPTPLRFFADHKIACATVACGAYHSLVLTTDKRVFGFGWNKNGRLGLTAAHVLAAAATAAGSSGGHHHSNSSLSGLPLASASAGAGGSASHAGSPAVPSAVPRLSGLHAADGLVTSSPRLLPPGALLPDGGRRRSSATLSALVSPALSPRAASPRPAVSTGVLAAPPSQPSGPVVVPGAGAGGSALTLSPLRASGPRASGGALGAGLAPVTTPTPIPAFNSLPSAVVSVHAGNAFSMVLCADGSVYSVGAGAWGVLGHGDQHDRDVPACVAGFGADGTRNNRVKALACGAVHTLALLDDGSVWSWGDNEHHALGRQTADRKQPTTSAAGAAVDAKALLPAPITSLPGPVSAVSAGKSHSAFVLAATGAVYTCGRGRDGQLGHVLPPPPFGVIVPPAAPAPAPSSSSGSTLTVVAATPTPSSPPVSARGHNRERSGAAGGPTHTTAHGVTFHSDLSVSTPAPVHEFAATAHRVRAVACGWETTAFVADAPASAAGAAGSVPPTACYVCGSKSKSVQPPSAHDAQPGHANGVATGAGGGGLGSGSSGGSGGGHSASSGNGSGRGSPSRPPLSPHSGTSLGRSAGGPMGGSMGAAAMM